MPIRIRLQQKASPEAMNNAMLAIVDKLNGEIPKLLRHLVNNVIKPEIIESAPTTEQEIVLRYGKDFDYDRRNYIVHKTIREALQAERPDVKGNIVRFGNIKGLNEQTKFSWKYKMRDAKGTLVTRTLDDSDEPIDTIEKFEFGGSWKIKPRPKEPGELKRHWLTPEPGGRSYQTITKTIPPFSMFKKGMEKAKPKIVQIMTESKRAFRELKNEDLWIQRNK